MVPMAGKYNRKDHLYDKAKAEGFRSRAAYKLMELDKKYGLIKPGYKVIDLGAWPGGWIQVAAKQVGANGFVAGIDLVEIDEVASASVKLYHGDVRDQALLKAAQAAAGGEFDLVLSDMSPKLSGIKDVDRMAAVSCAELARWAAGLLLRNGGNFVAKVFKGNETEEFIRATRPLYEKVVRTELSSTRKTSNEFYVVGFGKKP